ncbi:hypothetical protein CGRA01v4_10476 [Colletotrichum graminicola]|nr:hypothetical protein CGRA01v4_10476 [Colletotrichum graminicola]
MSITFKMISSREMFPNVRSTFSNKPSLRSNGSPSSEKAQVRYLTQSRLVSAEGVCMYILHGLNPPSITVLPHPRMISVLGARSNKSEVILLDRIDPRYQARDQAEEPENERPDGDPELVPHIKPYRHY